MSKDRLLEASSLQNMFVIFVAFFHTSSKNYQYIYIYRVVVWMVNVSMDYKHLFYYFLLNISCMPMQKID